MGSRFLDYKSLKINLKSFIFFIVKLNPCTFFKSLYHFGFRIKKIRNEKNILYLKRL